MKTSVIISFVFLAAVKLASAQGFSDYFPLHVGDYWVQHTDTISGGYQPTTFRIDIEAIDLIRGEEYFRTRQGLTEDDGSGASHWFIWVRTDSTGGVIGAFGDTSIVDSATIYDPPLPSFPNEALNLGYSWEYDFPGTGAGDQHWDCLVGSISETVEVPAGEFNDCIKIEIVITDTSGDTTQTHDLYYAKGVGQVLNIGWNVWQENFEFELTEYSVQSISINEDRTSIPQHFNLYQNYPNPFNPITTLRYDLPERAEVVLKVYDILGREVETILNRHMDSGYHTVQWSAGNVSTGIYFVRMESGNFTQTQKVMVLK